VTPSTEQQVVSVRCQVASDPRMHHIVASYHTITSAERDFTIKIDAHNLVPDQTYYFQFYAQSEASPIGRTRTLPHETDQIRLGVVSCANLPAGFFAAYGLLAQQDNLNAIIHLGDYTYEYANGIYGDGSAIDRIPDPNKETVTLSDYRTRLSQYHLDTQLQEAHRLHPWIMVWDDHEFADDAYKNGALNHQANEGDWEVRKANAMKAYFEWTPVRDNFGLRQASAAIFRRFRFGDLVQLDMLDTRIFGREQQTPQLIDGITSQLLVAPEELFFYLNEINRVDRQLLGQKQEQWLVQQMEAASESKAQWQILGQQVMMGQLSVAEPSLPPGLRIPLNTDQWDGYAAARQRILKYIESNDIPNTVILSGDFHSSWANDICYNPYDNSLYDPTSGSGSIAVEFVTPAVTSPFIVSADPVFIKNLEQFALYNNPHTKYVDLEKNGYMIVDIDRYRARAEYYHLDNALDPYSSESLAAKVETASGQNHAVLTEGQVSSVKKRDMSQSYTV